MAKHFRIAARQLGLDRKLINKDYKYKDVMKKVVDF